MYFNYSSEFILPDWLKERISRARTMIGQADEELKFGIKESFEGIPFNLVTLEVLKEKLKEVHDKYVKAFEKTPPKRSKDDKPVPTKQWNSQSFCNYHSLLQDTFVFSPSSMLVKKGVSSFGKEALVICIESPIPNFLFNTVYPLCWNAIDEKNKFSISKHPIYPLFHRFMQEPLAIAMSLSVIDKAFADEPRLRDSVINQLSYLPANYAAGVLLYNSGLHMRWKDWRDDSKRCHGKIDTIKEWIDLLSDPYEDIDSEKIISLWAKLFDLTAGEIQGLRAAGKYAPVVSENKDLPTLLLGLCEYAVKNHEAFQNDKVKQSGNHIAEVITRLVCKRISLDEAARKVSVICDDRLVRDFIGNVMTGWSFAQDLHNGCFRIYGPTVIAIAFSGVGDKVDSKSSKKDKMTNDS